MARLVITGASGYIGRRLVALALEKGHAVVVLGRAAVDDAAFFAWRLGEAAPADALAGADALIHLAHSWAADSQAAENLNTQAGETLARQALAAGVPRFVFASTNSARPGALNAYGRGKYALENILASLPGAEGRVVSARIALVYGGPPAGQYALMRKLTALTPVLPMLGLDRQVQPVHLDEVAAALLTLALNPALDAPYYVVAGAPITFARWLKLLRKVQTGGNLLLLPIPLKFMLFVCDIFPFLPRERVLGLAAAEAMPSAASLKALNLIPGDPFTLLMREERAQHSEARALLCYLGAPPTAHMLRDLDEGLARAGLAPLGLLPLLQRHPGLIALVEPPANRQSNRLARALYLAAQVIEAHRGSPPRNFARAVLLALLDVLALPVRLAASRRFR